MLGHVMHERLRCALGHLTQGNHLRASGVEVAESDEGRHTPRHRVRVDLGVSQLLRQVSRLREHRKDLLQWGRAARPVGANQHLGEARAILVSPCQRDRVFAHERATLALPREVERP